MANEAHLAILRQGVEVWNRWREKNRDVRPDLELADLREADLQGANLKGVTLVLADMRGAILRRADLTKANLSGVNLSEAILCDADLTDAELSGADMNGAMLHRANLSRAGLNGVLLRKASLMEADLTEAILSGADLSGANLCEAKLRGAELDTTHLSGANLAGANLTHAILTDTLLTSANLAGADLEHTELSGCRVYGVATSDIHLMRTTQRDLIMSKWDEADITVDGLEIAQLIAPFLYHAQLPDMIPTLTTHAVLILGWYPSQRKALFDAIRDGLRQCHYVPILFDFAFPTHRDLTEAVVTLARLSRFVIADLTSPLNLPADLMSFVRDLPAVPVQPIILKGHHMLAELVRYSWVLPTHEYASQAQLIVELPERVIEPAERMVAKLRPKLL